MSLIHLSDLAGLFYQFKLHAGLKSTAVTLNVLCMNWKQPSLCATFLSNVFPNPCLGMFGNVLTIKCCQIVENSAFSKGKRMVFQFKRVKKWRKTQPWCGCFSCRDDETTASLHLFAAFSGHFSSVIACRQWDIFWLHLKLFLNVSLGALWLDLLYLKPVFNSYL